MWLCRRWSRARLLGGQILLAVCLLLPLVQPWNAAVGTAPVSSAVVIATPGLAPPPAVTPAKPSIDWAPLMLLLLASVAIFRLACLAVRIGRLRRYRRESRPLEPAPAWSVEASLRVSDDVAIPVTFGWRDPVVLLPADFSSFSGPVQDAILCHEVLHVRRRDWLVTVGEEAVRALLWFHPAIWWLLGEIGLAREQEVDRQAIAITGQRQQYIDALLSIATSRSYGDLAAAPRFLRKGHLTRRMVSISDDSGISRGSVGSAVMASVILTVAAAWGGVAAFPLRSAPHPAPYAITVDPAGSWEKLDGIQFGAIAVVGLPEASRKALLARLPVRPGDPYSKDAVRWVTEKVDRFDPHLRLMTRFLLLPDGGGRAALLEILAPGADFTEDVERIRLSDYLMTPNLLKKVDPVVPKTAGHTSGAVLLDATVGTNGTVAALRAVRGPSAFIRPTMDAVRQWVYRPTVLDGRPVQVETLVEVLFPKN